MGFNVLESAKKSVSALGASQRLSRRDQVLGGRSEYTSLQSPNSHKGATVAKMGMKKSGGGKAKMMSPFEPAFGMKNAGGGKGGGKKMMSKRSSGKSR